MAAIILAGGKSRRMGENKALKILRGKSLIEHLVDRLSILFGKNIILVTNDPSDYSFLGLTMTPDLYPEGGPLAGIHAGLSVTADNLNFVVACDMPVVVPEAVRRILKSAPGYDAVVPGGPERNEPLFAAYRRSCLGPIERALDGGRRRVISFFPDVKVKWLDYPSFHDLGSVRELFFNVNRPEDWEEAEKLVDRDFR